MLRSIYIPFNILTLGKISIWRKDKLKKIEFLSIRVNTMYLPTLTWMWNKLESMLWKLQVEYLWKDIWMIQGRKIYKEQKYLTTITLFDILILNKIKPFIWRYLENRLPTSQFNYNWLNKLKDSGGIELIRTVARDIIKLF